MTGKILSVLRHCWLRDMKDIRPIQTTRPHIPDVLFQNYWKKKTESTANPGLSGKRPYNRGRYVANDRKGIGGKYCYTICLVTRRASGL